MKALPLLFLLALLSSCESLARGYLEEIGQYSAKPDRRVETIEKVRYVEAPIPVNPLLSSSTSLKVGPYILTDFERKALREIFGPPVVRWVEHHIRIGSERDFTGNQADACGFFQPDDKSIVLRLGPNEKDSQRFATLVHEVAHYWEYTQYKHFLAVRVTKSNTHDVYWIPPNWEGLNIEQEAEMLSVYAVLTYLFTRPDQHWQQWDTWYSRDDLPRIEAYLEKEMYF